MTENFYGVIMRPRRKPRKCNGYVLIYKPDYYLSQKAGPNKGYIYEHIYVVTKELGRRLHPNEIVHHLDLSRDNNDRANLIVLSKSDHQRLHAWISKHKLIRKKGREDKRCLHCGKIIRLTLKFCSIKCEASFSLSKIPSKEQLRVDMEDIGTVVGVGKKYGVSDNAVRKWLRRHSLPLKVSEYPHAG